MLVIGITLARLRSVPTGESQTLAIDPAELSFPLDIGGSDPEFWQLTEPASDPALRPLARDDRQLTAFHLTDLPRAFPVRLRGMV